MKKDYYKILGVDRGASAEEIKKIFYKLAHQCHPHKAGKDEKKFKELNEKFKEINEAYQVLSNKEKRSQYDRFGQVFEGGGTPGGFPGGGFGFGPEGFQWNVSPGDMGDFGDIFETIFSQFGGRRGRRPTYTRGSDVEFVTQITL